MAVPRRLHEAEDEHAHAHAHAHEDIARSLRIAIGFGGSPAAYPSARVAVIVAVIGGLGPLAVACAWRALRR